MTEMPQPEDLNPYAPRNDLAVSDFMGSTIIDPADDVVLAFSSVDSTARRNCRGDLQSLEQVLDTVEGVHGFEKQISAQTWLQSEGTPEQLAKYKLCLLQQLDMLDEIAEKSGIQLIIDN